MTHATAPSSGGTVRRIDLDDGETLLIRASTRRRSWLVTHTARGLLGGYRTLDAAMIAAQAYARDVRDCSAAQARLIAHS